MSIKCPFLYCCCVCKKSSNLQVDNDELMKNVFIENYIDIAYIKRGKSVNNKECFFCLEELDFKSQIIQLRCCKQLLHESCFQQWSEVELKKQNNNHEKMQCPFCQNKLFKYDICL